MASEPENPADVEARYRALLVELYERLTFRGISRTGKALSLLLEDVYIDLQVVTEAPALALRFDEPRDVEAGEGEIDRRAIERMQRESFGGRRSVEAVLAEPGRSGLVILGDPGSGKSTLLHLLALRAAKSADRLPIFVPLAAYDDWLRRNPEPTSLGDFLAVYYDVWRELAGLGPVFRKALDEGRALVLLDGLDEVLDVGTRQHVASEARALIHKESQAGNRFVVTSRIVGYREATLPGDLAHVTVVDFGESEIARFAHKWCEATEVWLAGGEPTDAAQLRAKAEESALLEEVEANESVLRLAANPLLLTMLALLRRQGGKLPDERVRLYQRYVEALLDNNWETVRSEGARTKEPDRFDQRLATDYLIELALWLQQNKPSGTARKSEIEAALTDFALRLDGLDPAGAPPSARKGATDKAARFLADMSHFAGLLVAKGRDAFGFHHLTFQEYFAGRALARMEPDERWAILKPNLHKPRWREPILLCAGQLGIVERRSKAVSDLGRRILSAESAYENLLHRDVFLLGAMAADNVGLDKALLDELAGQFIELTESQVPKIRAVALRALASLLPLEHDNTRSWWEERVRSKTEPYEIAEALKGLLGGSFCAELRRALMAWSKEPDSSTHREVAIAVLGASIFDDHRVLPILVEKLNDSAANVRWTAIHALRPVVAVNREVRTKILSQLQGRSGTARGAAVRVLGPLAANDVEVRAALLLAATDDDLVICWSAIAELWPIPAALPQVRARVVTKLDEPRGLHHPIAAHALQKILADDRTLLNAVAKQLKTPDAMTRAVLVEALAPLATNDARVRRLVQQRLADVDSTVRAEAVRAVSPMIAIDPRLHARLVRIMKARRDPVGTDALEALTNSPDADTRASVADLAARTLRGEAPWANRDVLELPFRARRRAAAILGNLGHRELSSEALSSLVHALQYDEEKDVRDAAYESLLRVVETPESTISRISSVPAPDVSGPPTLERLSIRHFKNLENLALDFTHGSALQGRWTCIAGINGAGKSAILQAIALLFLGENLASDIGSEWLKRMRRREGDRSQDAVLEATLRRGDKEETVTLVLGEKGIDRDRITEHPSYVAMRAFWDARPQYLIVGYGAGRNLSERLGDDDGKNPDVRRLMTLFDPLYPLASADVLLHQRQVPPQVLTLLRRLLGVILEGAELAIAPELGPLRFITEGAHVPPADLPDGFRATIAWLADLCATWYEKAPEEALTDDPTRIRGIVLVDEIDLHLHAKLQRVLISRLRKALPHVQWIVTTHSPLILSSFDRREIVALDHNQPGGVRVLDRQIIGFTVNEIYEWLMETDTRSEAFDELLTNGTADASQILVQSPEVSEQDVADTRALLRDFAARKRSTSGAGGA